MEITPECVPCLLGRVIYEARLADPAKVPAAIRSACAVFARRYRPGRVSARLATEVHRAVYRALGTRDPYAKVKRDSNRAVLRLFPRAERLVERSRDRLRAAVLCSIAGNILDFGIGGQLSGPGGLDRAFGRIVREGLAVDHLPRIARYLRQGSRVLYFADNCGEIVLDRLVLRELRRRGARVTLVVRGEPVLTDATMEDVEELGLRSESDDVMDTGSFAVGVDFDRIPARLRRALGQRDLIVSKGMANFESFSGTRWRPIIHLMRTKCGPVAEAAGAPRDASVAMLWT